MTSGISFFEMHQRDFLDFDEYIIEEKASYTGFHHDFKIYDKDGGLIGNITQQNLSGTQILSRLTFGKMSRLIEKRSYTITDIYHNDIARIQKADEGISMRFNVFDGRNNPIGQVKLRWNIVVPGGIVYDENGLKIAEIKGNFIGWNFQIIGYDGLVIGEINKQISGLFKELVTTMDKYRVAFNGISQKNQKTLMLAAAVILDSFLHEEKE